MIYDSLYEHLTANELLNPNQSGFRPNDSTINQLISIVHTTFFAFDCNPPLDVRSVYLDISKAFDRVWHEGLIINFVVVVFLETYFHSSKTSSQIESSAQF